MRRQREKSMRVPACDSEAAPLPTSNTRNEAFETFKGIKSGNGDVFPLLLALYE